MANKTKSPPLWYEPSSFAARTNYSTVETAVPPEYRACFVDALRRMVLVLNSKERGFSQARRKSNEHIQLLFEKSSPAKSSPAKISLDGSLIDLAFETRAGAQIQQPADDDEAENSFYGRFSFTNEHRGKRSKVVFRCTEAFLSWSYLRLTIPRDAHARHGLVSGASFERDCAASYLLKNFWHNFVHHKLQLINDNNFGNFRGNARLESDFVADNLGAILHAHSYGVSVKTTGTSGPKHEEIARAVTARNRCNFVFAERAARRLEELSDIQSFEEREWMFRRRVANRLSEKLIAKGACVFDLAVYLNGSIRERREKSPKRSRFYRDGQIVVRLNGMYHKTNIQPYLEDEDYPDLTVAGKTRIRDVRNKRIDYAVDEAWAWYVGKLREPEGALLRDHAAKSLAALGERLGVHFSI